MWRIALLRRRRVFVIAVLRQELNAKKEQKAGTDENA
jgi:hypothetical protein